MRIKWPEKKENYDYDQEHASWGNADDSFSEGVKVGEVYGYNESIDACIAAEKESRMGVEEIHSIIYDFCEEKEIEIQPDWLCELAQALHTALYGESEDTNAKPE